MKTNAKTPGIIAASLLTLSTTALGDPGQSFQAVDVVDIEGINTEMTMPERTGVATLRRTKTAWRAAS